MSFKGAIKYKDTWAMPKSELHTLLTDANNAKDPKVAQELRKKAERCYTECLQRYKKLMEGN